MPKVEAQRIAVIGAGPVGLEAALYAKVAGFAVTVFERGQIAENHLHWGHVKLFTPFGMNVTPLGLQTLQREKTNHSLPAESDLHTGRQYRDAYLVPLAESALLLESIHTQTAVLQVGRSSGIKKTNLDEKRPFRLLVRDGKGQERIEVADAILDCTGTGSNPNWLGDGSIPAVGELAARPHFATGLEDVLGARKDHYAGKSIVLVGDGYSAATTICNLASLAEEHPATWVIWLTRGPRGQPLPRLPNDPLKERDRLALRANALATRCDGNLEFHPQTLIDEVTCHGPNQGFRIAGRSNGKPVCWDVERLIACVGHRPETKLMLNEPGYYRLGANGATADAGVPMRDGFDQIRQVFAAITGNARLDLYARKAA